MGGHFAAHVASTGIFGLALSDILYYCFIMNITFKYEQSEYTKALIMANASNWMVSRKELAAQFPLDTQSRGRELTKPEQDFAVALESVFAQGVHDMKNVAGALTRAGVTAPGSGDTHWDIETLASELTAINASLDEAFKENGYGA